MIKLNFLFLSSESESKMWGKKVKRQSPVQKQLLNYESQCISTLFPAKVFENFLIYQLLDRLVPLQLVFNVKF